MKVFLLALAVILACVFGMCFNIIFRKDGEFPEYEVSKNKDAKDPEPQVTITNTHKRETTDVVVSKRWQDAGHEKERPTSITVRLLANGREVDHHAVTPSDDWKWTFKGKPAYEGGKKIAYTAREDALDGYETKVSGTTIVNTFAKDTTSVSISKVGVPV